MSNFSVAVSAGVALAGCLVVFGIAMAEWVMS
jgi:archaellum component FlaF (FlaF/FlaG flagellin family)